MKHILYDWGHLNVAFFYIINGFHNPLYDQFMLFMTILGKYTMFAIYFPIILATAYWKIRAKRLSSGSTDSHYQQHWYKVILVMLLAYFFMAAWVYLLKHWIALPRPFATLPLNTIHIMDSVLQKESAAVSFPSGHCAFAIFMAAGLWPVLNKPGKIIACFYVILVAWSRIALGVHFPADVAWSLLMSLIGVYLIKVIVDKTWGLFRKI